MACTVPLTLLMPAVVFLAMVSHSSGISVSLSGYTSGRSGYTR
jgi:hypothetical protein